MMDYDVDDDCDDSNFGSCNNKLNDDDDMEQLYNSNNSPLIESPMTFS